MKTDFPSPPPHLRPETAAWWRSITADFSLEPHHIRLLRLACEAWDAGQAAREAIAEHGPVYVDRFGQPRARPEVAIERDNRIAFARLMRDLALDVDGPAAEEHRPPRITGNARLRTTG
jgi:phage terminase small subunit